MQLKPKVERYERQEMVDWIIGNYEKLRRIAHTHFPTKHDIGDDVVQEYYLKAQTLMPVPRNVPLHSNFIYFCRSKAYEYFHVKVYQTRRSKPIKLDISMPAPQEAELVRRQTIEGLLAPLSTFQREVIEPSFNSSIIEAFEDQVRIKNYNTFKSTYCLGIRKLKKTYADKDAAEFTLDTAPPIEVSYEDDEGKFVKVVSL